MCRFFMECPFHSERQDERDLAILIAKKLIQNCSELRISDIVIPCVDQSSLRSSKPYRCFYQSNPQDYSSCGKIWSTPCP